jgi:hypothetical protein
VSPEATFYGSGTFTPVVADVEQNLAKAGYAKTSEPMREEDPRVTTLNQSFRKGDETIVIAYKLKTPYICLPAGNTNFPCSKTFQLSQVASQPLSEITASYSRPHQANY